jgi:hypothetical protein
MYKSPFCHQVKPLLFSGTLVLEQMSWHKGLISDIEHNDTQHKTLCQYAEWHCAECRNLFIVMLNVIILNVVMLSVVAPTKVRCV